MTEDFDYSEFVASVLTQDEGWIHEAKRTGLWRFYMSFIFVAASKAVQDLRAKGTLIDIMDWGDRDSFSLSANTRTVIFSRKEETISLTFIDIPDDLTPDGRGITRLSLPAHTEMQNRAKAVIKMALKPLFAKL